MTPADWARVKEVLGAALERPEPERAAFLEQACMGESWLREEVDRLLAAHLTQSLESPLARHAQPELAPGQMLGHYRVESKLGQGGMGAVYKARDEKLQRPAALKILSSRHFDDPAGKQRFLREARSASALNHPHIVTIYEAGTDGRVDFIAMELIEGQSLDRLIPAQGLPLDRALDYAIAVAGALAKAHSAGIVHRDLKPANIMVTRDAQVKLLDFGLARRVHRADDETATLTRQGEVFGTPAYMSPEQAEGRSADERSDIFSFGVVLYEMLSGRRAFTGNSTAAVLSAVLKEEPPPLNGVPPALTQLVARCVHKDPARRPRHIEEARLLLEEIRAAARRPVAAPERRGRTVRSAALVAVVVCVCLMFWFIARGRWGQVAEMRAVPLTSLPGYEIHPSFSPDGRQVAFAWNADVQNNYDIYVTVVGSTAAPLRLTNDPAADLYPAWSPDGGQIAFLRQRTLYLIPALGGPERKLAEIQPAPSVNNPGNPFGWSPDGKWLVVGEGPWEGPWTISLVSVQRGDKRVLSSDVGVPRAPAFSPAGGHLAYISCPHSLGAACDIYVLELTSNLAPKGHPRRLTRTSAFIQGLAWTPDGQSMVYSASRCPTGVSTLWRVGAFGSAPPQRIDAAGPGAEGPVVSPSGGRLAYVRRSEDADIWRFQVGSDAPVRFISSTQDEHNAQYSPDGNRIAFVSNRTASCPEIWVSDRDGANALPLTSGLNKWQGTPRWSPDGHWIAFDQNGDDGHTDIFVMDASGGRQRRLTPFPSDESVPSWSRDGKWIYFRSNRSGGNEIWKMPFQGGEAVPVTEDGGYAAFESWDGKMLYYLKTPSPDQLFAKPLAGGPERPIISTSILGRAFYPVQGGLYFIGSGPAPATPTLEFYDLSTGRRRVLAAIKGRLRLGLTVSPDRKSVLFSLNRTSEADLILIENFR